MDKYIAKTLIKHNGKRYEAGSEIELEDAAELLEIDAVKPVKKTNPDNDKNGAGAQAPDQPPVNPTNVGAEGEKDGQTPPNPKSADGKEYSFMKDAEQVEFLKTLSDEELKNRFNELLEVSKTQAKKAIKNRLKSGNTDK